jgi:hypothetical protein
MSEGWHESLGATHSQGASAGVSAGPVMNGQPQSEAAHRAALRFGITGVIFSVMSPVLFWLAYPMGPFLAAALAEFTVHTIRFHTFRWLVFPAAKGYRVSLPRYILSALPIWVAVFVSVAFFRNRLDRTTLTIVTAFTTVTVSFLWSRYVYTKPAGKL